MSFEEIDEKVKQSAPLLERLDECQTRIGKMCKEGRPPKMTIPVQWSDDDVFIVATIKEAVEQLRTLDGVLVSVNEGNEITCKVCGRGSGAKTPRQ